VKRVRNLSKAVDEEDGGRQTSRNFKRDGDEDDDESENSFKKARCGPSQIC
jgi:hypothetical protein